MPPKIIRKCRCRCLFRNKLAQPKQNHRAGDHYGNIGELVQEGNLAENSLPATWSLSRIPAKKPSGTVKSLEILVELFAGRIRLLPDTAL